MMQGFDKSKLDGEDYSYLRYYYEWESVKVSVAEQHKKEGIKEGKREGIKEGKREGIKEGKREEKEEIVLNAIAEGFDNETIAKLTKLSIEEIENIRKTNT